MLFHTFPAMMALSRVERRRAALAADVMDTVAGRFGDIDPFRLLP